MLVAGSFGGNSAKTGGLSSSTLMDQPYHLKPEMRAGNARPFLFHEVGYVPPMYWYFDIQNAKRIPHKITKPTMERTTQPPTIQGQYKRFFSLDSSTPSMTGGLSTPYATRHSCSRIDAEGGLRPVGYHPAYTRRGRAIEIDKLLET